MLGRTRLSCRWWVVGGDAVTFFCGNLRLLLPRCHGMPWVRLTWDSGVKQPASFYFHLLRTRGISLLYFTADQRRRLFILNSR